MYANVDKVLEAQQSMVKFAQHLGSAAIEGNKKLMALNFAAAEAALKEGTLQSQAFFAEAKNPSDLMKALSFAHLQPMAEKTQAYFKHVYDISTETGKEMAAVVQAHTADSRAQFDELLTSFSKSAPAGVKNYFEGFANFFKAAEQAVVEPKTKRK